MPAARDRKAAKPPAMPVYVRDFDTDEAVRVMDVQHVGAYFLLLMSHWLEGSIPATNAAQAKICRITPRRMASLWPLIAPKFVPAPDVPDRLINLRLVEELAKTAYWMERSREGGLRSAAARAAKAGKPQVAAPAAPPPAPDLPDLLGTAPAPRERKKRRTKGEQWTVVPESWEPKGSHIDLAAQLGVDLEHQAALFRDHEYREPKSDADRAFNTWLRNARRFEDERASRSPRPRALGAAARERQPDELAAVNGADRHLPPPSTPLRPAPRRPRAGGPAENGEAIAAILGGERP